MYEEQSFIVVNGYETENYFNGELENGYHNNEK